MNSKKSKDAKIDETINRYKDLSSHIKVKYVDPATSPKFYQDYTDTTPTTNSLIIESKNRSKVIDYNDIYEFHTLNDLLNHTPGSEIITLYSISNKTSTSQMKDYFKEFIPEK